jgi:hypothetical protein
LASSPFLSFKKPIFMKKITYTFFLIFVIITTGFSQNITATLRGTIQDATNEQPLVGATIAILNTDSTLGTTTDSNGDFTFKSVKIGRYQVKISYLGYEILTLTEVLLESGKERVLTIKLKESSADLQEIVVKAPTENNDISPLSNHLITIEEVKRFPATFFDPARLAMLYPGVTGTNDQANGLSIRGLPPSLLQWRLEGVEIVNPNHLSNAGTISDQPSVAAGGVNILSAQMLDNSRLYTGAFPIEYSNALGGVMDMRLRKGNNQQHEFTAQAGLLGFDLGMEGPFSKKSKASFLFNYRYSFTGLLTNFGVDFDGEEIGFEDVSFNLNFPTKKAGNFMIFGIGGRSDNFKAALPEEEVEEFRDLADITYQSTTGILGLAHNMAVGRKTVWKTTFAYSQSNNSYRQLFGEDSDFNSRLINKKVSGQTSLVSTILPFFKIKGGINFQHNIKTDSFPEGFVSYHRTTTRQITPFANLNFQLCAQLIFNVGLNANFVRVERYFNNTNIFFNGTEQKFKMNNEFSIDPRSSLIWTPNKNHQISFFAGIFSKMMNLENYWEIKTSRETNVAYFEFSRAFQQSLKYQNTSFSNLKLSLEIFHQRIKHIPVTNFNDVLINVDEFNFLFGIDIRNFEGRSRNYGIELMIQRYFNKNWYFLASGTLYEAQYKNENRFIDKYEIARFNGNWVSNITVGKEFIKQKIDKTNIFGIHFRGVHRGGFWERPIEEFDGDIFFSGDSFTEKLPNYFRIDLRLYLKWNKANRTTSLSLDLQNTTNYQNVAYTYIDRFGADEIKTQYQLGLIPLLNYRIEF